MAIHVERDPSIMKQRYSCEQVYLKILIVSQSCMFYYLYQLQLVE